MVRAPPETPHDYMARYPRVTSHVICQSLGYATPSCAARILSDAYNRRENWCEWLDACYNHDAVRCVRDSIRGRHGHHGYMADYSVARALVRRATDTGREPEFASWF